MHISTHIHAHMYMGEISYYNYTCYPAKRKHFCRQPVCIHMRSIGNQSTGNLFTGNQATATINLQATGPTGKLFYKQPVSQATRSSPQKFRTRQSAGAPSGPRGPDEDLHKYVDKTTLTTRVYWVPWDASEFYRILLDSADMHVFLSKHPRC